MLDDEIIVTKRGKPVAKLVPVGLPTATARSVTLLAGDDDAYDARSSGRFARLPAVGACPDMRQR